MIETLDSYSEYAQKTLDNYTAKDAASRYALVEAVKNRKIRRVLDVGCGLGQDLLPFAEKTEAFCFGVDRAAEIADFAVKFFSDKGYGNRAAFARSTGESLPFADESFDIVMCRLALPYMNNNAALSEFARVLQPDGAILLKIHAPPFYFAMIRERAKTFSPRLLAYPLICLANGFLYQMTEKQPSGKFWQGKEVYQTKKLLDKRLQKLRMRIEGELPDTNAQAPSFIIKKQ
ncbi:MAG TPA: class I SAM-dependent methyltransferase [Pyrinomonadaceae bacterium]|jgi:ubiquinone/menaquinone biosynthesis C-methylase UbiE